MSRIIIPLVFVFIMLGLVSASLDFSCSEHVECIVQTGKDASCVEGKCVMLQKAEAPTVVNPIDIFQKKDVQWGFVTYQQALRQTKDLQCLSTNCIYFAPQKEQNPYLLFIQRVLYV